MQTILCLFITLSLYMQTIYTRRSNLKQSFDSSNIVSTFGLYLSSAETASVISFFVFFGNLLICGLSVPLFVYNCYHPIFAIFATVSKFMTFKRTISLVAGTWIAASSVVIFTTIDLHIARTLFSWFPHINDHGNVHVHVQFKQKT